MPARYAGDNSPPITRSVARRLVESATKETLGTIKQMLEQTPAR
jgi:hypothetical protein